MKKDTEITSAEKDETVKVLSENTQESIKEISALTDQKYSGSITVSVNAHRATVAEEETVDENWLDNDDSIYECLPDNSSADPGSGENDVCQFDDPEENDSDDSDVYDVEEFDDADSEDDTDSEDDEDYDGANDGSVKKLDVKKAGCVSCSAVFLLLIILVVAFSSVFYHYYRLMDIDDDDSIYYNDKVTFSDTEISEIPDGNVKIEDGSVFKDKSVFNILLIGTDERTKGFSKNARADSIMILSLDSNTNRIRLVSLERGMLVQIPGHKDDILTHTFRYGGSKLLMQTVRTHFKLDVDKYIRVNFSMFQKLVDEVGGVDIELTEKEAYGLNTYPNNNTWKLKRKVHEGLNHFDGYEALQYSRLRWIDDDFHRIERQRKVIISIKESMNDLSVSDLKDISKDCLPYVQTNLSAIEFAELLIKMPGYINNDINQMTIPKKGTYKTLGNVDFNENTAILKGFLYEGKYYD